MRKSGNNQIWKIGNKCKIRPASAEITGNIEKRNRENPFPQKTSRENRLRQVAPIPSTLCKMHKLGGTISEISHGIQWND